MKPYIHEPKPNYLSAPPGAPGGLEEGETIYEKWSASERRKRAKKCANPKGFTMKQFCKNRRKK